MEKMIEIHLPDLGELREEENFYHELQVNKTEIAPLVLRSFTLQPVKTILSSSKDSLQYQVKFEPMRPFHTEAELLISKSSGGRWKFNLVLEAKEGTVDDTITIEAAMGRTAAVRFKLSNRTKMYAPFRAGFAQDSDPGFAVEPQEGLLEPYGKSGTVFTVSFTAMEYGPVKSGKLEIVTEEMQWTYAVRGIHPKYHLPTIHGGRIDNHLSPEIQDKLNTSIQLTTKKNFVRDNLKSVSFPRSTSELRRRL